MAVQLPEHYKETSVSNPNAIGNGITNASQTATKYITTIDSNNGIRVHAENIASTDYAQLDATGLNVVKSGTSVASFGSTTRIGPASGAHLAQNSNQIDLYNASGDRFATLDMNGLNFVDELGSPQGGVGVYSWVGTDERAGGGYLFLGPDVHLDGEVYGAQDYMFQVFLADANGSSNYALVLNANELKAVGKITAADGEAYLNGSSTYIILGDDSSSLFRFNKTNGAVGYYNGSAWVNLAYVPQSTTFTLSNATAGTHSCRRSNNVATINARGLKVSSSLASGSSVAIGTVPSGYRPAEYVHATVNTTTVANSWGLFVVISSSGTITLYNEASVALPTSASLYFTATYVM